MTATPTFVEPMELLAVNRLPEGPEWSYEVKLDGYRAQAIHGARLRLLSRRGKDFSSQLPEADRRRRQADTEDQAGIGFLLRMATLLEEYERLFRRQSSKEQFAQRSLASPGKNHR